MSDNNHERYVSDFERERLRRRGMLPSQRLDILASRAEAQRNTTQEERLAGWGENLRPVTLEQLERAEAAVNATPLFSEGETYSNMFFGTDIPVAREVQSGDGMAGDETDNGGRVLTYAILGAGVAVLVLIAWALGAGR